MESEEQKEFVARSCGRIAGRYPDDGSAETAFEVLASLRAGWTVVHRKIAQKGKKPQ